MGTGVDHSAFSSFPITSWPNRDDETRICSNSGWLISLGKLSWDIWGLWAEWSHERHLGASSWLDPMARQKLWMGAWLSGRAADLPDLSKNSGSWVTGRWPPLHL